MSCPSLRYAAEITNQVDHRTWSETKMRPIFGERVNKWYELTAKHLRDAPTRKKHKADRKAAAVDSTIKVSKLLGNRKFRLHALRLLEFDCRLLHERCMSSMYPKLHCFVDSNMISPVSQSGVWLYQRTTRKYQKNSDSSVRESVVDGTGKQFCEPDS